MILSSFLIRLIIESGSLSLSSITPTNNSFTFKYSIFNKLKASTNSIIPLSITSLPEKPLYVCLSLNIYIALRKFLHIYSVTCTFI